MWQNLPIGVRKRVRKRSGYRLPSSRISDRGFNICGLREFEAGDTPRSVSRRHYVRTGEEIVIERHPERNALILILLDASASVFTGAYRLKYDASLELLRYFVSACLRRGNTVQVIAFTTSIEFESQIISCVSVLEAVIEDLASLRPVSTGTDHGEILDRALSIAGKSPDPADLVCVVSDLLFPQPRERFFRSLEDLQDTADVIALVMRDRIEEVMPTVRGALMVRDAETGERFWACSTGACDPVTELENFGFDTCVLLTSQTEEEWFKALFDFFTMRMVR